MKAVEEDVLIIAIVALFWLSKFGLVFLEYARVSLIVVFSTSPFGSSALPTYSGTTHNALFPIRFRHRSSSLW